MKLEELQQLIRLLRSEGVTEFELEEKGVKLRLKRERTGGRRSGSGAAEAALAVEAPPAEPVAAPSASKDHLIKSPIVGTFYRSPSPGAEPFVEIGRRVKVGETLCVVEAMKLMNEIAADANGTVAAILVENGQPVEYGQALFQLALDR
ncbi:MAG TPA: acetyl-CoA carboxylase biotin carboxyl carrier protein [Acidobacteriota bacterium]